MLKVIPKLSCSPENKSAILDGKNKAEFMNISQLKGYVLEDAISKLLEVNGYRLITKVSMGNDDLRMSGNGLNLIGRGGYHQFDSLGELKWVPPFVFPIRLFTEVKFRTDKASIDLVRKGLGILVDINHSYSTIDLTNIELNLPRYNYHYAIFSTSGFSENAIRMALAHKIHLIDLSGAEYVPLINAVVSFVDRVFDHFHDGDNKISTFIGRWVRRIFRSIIQLSEESDSLDYENNKEDGGVYPETLLEFQELVREWSSDTLNEIESIGSLYLASTKSPFLIVLKPEDNRMFIESLRLEQKQQVAITWESEDDLWTIQNINFVLTFSLPKTLAKHIFTDNRNRILETAIDVKNAVFSSFTFVAYLNNDIPTMCSLDFDAEMTQGLVDLTNYE